MKLTWTVLVAVAVVNTLYMVFMYFLQAVDKGFLPTRHSIIPGTNQRFLYVQDFHSCTWGDFFAIPLIANAFVCLAMNGFVGLWQWAIFAIIAFADGFWFLRMCLSKDHKPDQGYPDIGEVSWHGLSHLPYHGVCVAMSALIIWHIIIAGNLWGPVLWVALFGGALYITSFVADVKSGNFEPLKRL